MKMRTRCCCSLAIIFCGHSRPWSCIVSSTTIVQVLEHRQLRETCNDNVPWWLAGQPRGNSGSAEEEEWIHDEKEGKSWQKHAEFENILFVFFLWSGPQGRQQPTKTMDLNGTAERKIKSHIECAFMRRFEFHSIPFHSWGRGREDWTDRQTDSPEEMAIQGRATLCFHSFAI